MNARQIKHPAKAGAFNLVLGFGNFYLSHETQETSQWMYGLFNLLLWPPSMVWGVPQAAIDANTMNTRETIYYYTKNPKGIAELIKLKNKNNKQKEYK